MSSLSSALMYIDNILLFSLDLVFHTALLHQFHSIVLQYGIMLFKKTMKIDKSEIDFLGMKISNGQFELMKISLVFRIGNFPTMMQMGTRAFPTSSRGKSSSFPVEEEEKMMHPNGRTRRRICRWLRFWLTRTWTKELGPIPRLGGAVTIGNIIIKFAKG
ncbi:hypothetical protein ACSBR2_012918 [Camellia fascicularis]